MPSKITDFSPKQISNLASRNGWTVEPLGKGRLAGIPYEQGGGISMQMEVLYIFSIIQVVVIME